MAEKQPQSKRTQLLFLGALVVFGGILLALIYAQSLSTEDVQPVDVASVTVPESTEITEESALEQYGFWFPALQEYSNESLSNQYTLTVYSQTDDGEAFDVLVQYDADRTSGTAGLDDFIVEEFTTSQGIVGEDITLLSEKDGAEIRYLFIYHNGHGYNIEGSDEILDEIKESLVFEEKTE